MSDIHAAYLADLGHLIREAGEAAKEDAASAADEDRVFQQGRQMAYYEVLSLMQQQAIAFDLPFSEVSLQGFDADRDVL
ncbi:MAG TPA: hypothetical protein VGH82_01745 [Gaiellaceae bacterium]|jgi:hypothetical protein